MFLMCLILTNKNKENAVKDMNVWFGFFFVCCILVIFSLDELHISVEDFRDL